MNAARVAKANAEANQIQARNDRRARCFRTKLQRPRGGSLVPLALNINFYNRYGARWGNQIKHMRQEGCLTLMQKVVMLLKPQTQLLVRVVSLNILFRQQNERRNGSLFSRRQG